MGRETRALIARVVCALACAATALGLMTAPALAASGMTVSRTGTTSIDVAGAVVDVDDWRNFTIDTSGGDGHFQVFRSDDTHWLHSCNTTESANWKGWDALLIGNEKSGTGIFAKGNWSLSGKVTLTWPNGVLAYDGSRYDLVMEVSGVHGRWSVSPECKSTRLMSILWFDKTKVWLGGGEENIFIGDGDLGTDAHSMRGNVGVPGTPAKRAKLGCACDIKVYAQKSGAASSLKYNLAFIDVDQPDFSGGEKDFNGLYAESVQLKGSNFNNAVVYVNQASTLNWSSPTNWIWASATTANNALASDPTAFTVQTTLNKNNLFMVSTPGAAYTRLFCDYSYKLNARTEGNGTVAIKIDGKKGLVPVDGKTSGNMRGDGDTVTLQTIPKQNYYVEATPDLGYHVGTVKLDGRAQTVAAGGGAKTVDVKNVSADHSVVAAFAPWDLTVRYHANGGAVGRSVTNYRVGTDGLVEGLSNKRWADVTTVTNVAATNGDEAKTSKWTGFVDLCDARGGAFGLTRTGYHLTAGEEWNTKADGTGTAYNQDSTSASVANVAAGSKLAAATSGGFTTRNKVNYLTAAKTVELYADWMPYALTVRYFANDATHDGAAALAETNALLKGPDKYRYDTNDFATSGLENANGGAWDLWKLGYHATDLWRVDSQTASKTVSADTTYAKVQDLANEVGKSIDAQDNSVDLYAVLAPNTYNIAYDLRGGSLAEWAPTKATYDEGFEVPAPTRDGYVFEGWKITGMDDNRHVIGGEETFETEMTGVIGQQSYLNLHATQDATVTYTARWHPKNATLKRVILVEGVGEDAMAELTAWLEGASEGPTVDADGNVHLRDMSVETGATVSVGTVPTLSATAERTLPGGNTVSYTSGWVPDGWYLDDPACGAGSLAAELDGAGRAAFWVPDDGRTEFTLYARYDQKIVDGVTSAT